MIGRGHSQFYGREVIPESVSLSLSAEHLWLTGGKERGPIVHWLNADDVVLLVRLQKNVYKMVCQINLGGFWYTCTAHTATNSLS